MVPKSQFDTLEKMNINYNGFLICSDKNMSDTKGVIYILTNPFVTLNVYTHASYDRAAEQMAKIIDFKRTVTPEKQRKSG